MGKLNRASNQEITVEPREMRRPTLLQRDGRSTAESELPI